MDDAEYDEVQEAADARRLTVSAWVRQTLRAARAAAGEVTKTSSRGASSPTAEGAAGLAADPTLVRQVMQRHGLSSPAEAIDLALRRAAEPPLSRSDLLALRGTGWAGDLAALRATRRDASDQGGEPAS